MIIQHNHYKLSVFILLKKSLVVSLLGTFFLDRIDKTMNLFLNLFHTNASNSVIKAAPHAVLSCGTSFRKFHRFWASKPILWYLDMPSINLASRFKLVIFLLILENR